MSKWREFYRGREGDDYLEYVKSRYSVFIETILAHLSPGDVLVEQGCGTGTITRSIFDRRITIPRGRALLLDNERDMLDLAIQRNPGAIGLIQNCWFAVPIANPFIVHSHGLLEHLDDRMIRQTIFMNNAARWQVHYVPGKYPEPSFGDERLMSAEEWKAICDPTEIRTFNDGLDLILIFERGAGRFSF